MPTTTDKPPTTSCTTTTTTTSRNTDKTDDTNDNANDDKITAITEDSSSQPLQLRKNLGLIPGISYVAGGIIGVGIFVSPQSVLMNVGQSVGVALCVWAFCAFIAFCGALCYAELGTRIRKSGGSYTYLKSGFGDGLGFLYLWTHLVVVRPLSTALAALAASEYFLRPLFLYCPQIAPKPAKLMVALCIVGLLVFMNSYSTRWGAIFQTVSTVCKLSALIVVIVIGITFLIKDGVSEDLREPFSSQELSVQGITLAIYSCTYAYMGWDNLVVATEEVKNPQRNIPLSVLFGVVLTAVVYLLANVSYHAVLTTPQIVSGVAIVAIFTEMTVPLLMWVLVPCIAISAMGIVNCNIFSSSRLNFIGGRDGLFPEVLSMVNVSRKTPLVSCLVLGVSACVVVLIADDISSVLGAYSMFKASGETLGIIAIFSLRRKYPATDSTFVAPTVFPVIYLVVNISLPIMAIARDTSRYVIPLLLSLSGIPVYFLSTSRMFRRGPLGKLNDLLINMSRKLLLCDFASKSY